MGFGQKFVLSSKFVIGCQGKEAFRPARCVPGTFSKPIEMWSKMHLRNHLAQQLSSICPFLAEMSDFL